MDETYSSSSDEEEFEEDGQNDEILLDAPSVSPTVPSAPSVSQKRSHVSLSSYSDKDVPPPE